MAYLILSYAYVFSDRLDHFDVLDLELDTNENIKDFIPEVEKFLDKHELEIKQIKDITDNDKKYNSLKLICKYNNKMITKNKIITKLTTLPDVTNVKEI